jgi:hypothetical protein
MGGMAIDWQRVKEQVRDKAQRAHKYLEKAQDVAYLAAQLQGKPGPLAMLGLAVSGAKMAADLLRAEERRGLQRVNFPTELSAQVRDILKGKMPMGRDRDNDPMFEVDGRRIVTQDNLLPLIWSDRDPEAVREFLVDQLRSEFGGHLTIAPQGDAVQVRRAPPPEGASSATADHLWERLALFALAGHTRVLLLDGPPGTGKSTIARNLAARVCAAFPGPSLRVAVSDLANLEPSVLQVLVEALRPTVVIIDDLDRLAGGSAQLLDLFESLHGPHGPRVVVVTTNEQDALPEALLRPGRIDEVATVEGVGRDLALTILGDQAGKLTPEHLDAAAGWPAAHVAELALRLRTIPGVDVGAEVASVGGRARAPLVGT